MSSDVPPSPNSVSTVAFHADTTAPAALAVPSPAASVSAAPSPVAANAAEKINVAADSEGEKKEDGTPKQEGCCAPDNLKEVGRSLVLVLGFVFPFFTACLMGLYYLYDKYRDDLVWAFAIIWLVFVVAGIIGLIYSWQIREKEAVIAANQAAEEERLAQEGVIKAAQEKHEEAEKKRLAKLQAETAGLSASPSS
jgi:membrane protein insertase Oxa1/YidC/SpoIIIJ